jgi:hypothetical protein
MSHVYRICFFLFFLKKCSKAVPQERKHNWKFEFLCWAFHYEGAAKAVSRRPPSHTRKKVRAMWDPPQK